VYKVSPSTTPGALLPLLEALAILSKEAHQGKLGYKNHLIYNYLAHSQAQN